MNNAAKDAYEATTYHLLIPEQISSTRLDAYITEQFPKYSRTFFQKLIDQGLVTVNKKRSKASYQIKPNDIITVEIPPARVVPQILSEAARAQIEKLPVSIVYEDPEFFIINKPAGLIVHKPSAMSTTITLVDWLLYKFPNIVTIGDQARPGIVHRLDKDTSGLMIIARTQHAHKELSDMFRHRTIKKIYLAVVQGHPKKSGTIDLAIGRDILQPTKMSHATQKSRSAITNFEVLEYLPDAAVVKVNPITGRTHQIRVHFAAKKHPIIGDTLYGTQSKLIHRQALHAAALSFTFHDQSHTFNQELPNDMVQLIEQLKKG